MKVALSSLTLTLSLLLALPVMAGPRDLCWDLTYTDTDTDPVTVIDGGTLRLRTVHSIANEDFVLSGSHETADGAAYAVSGGAVYIDDTYKASLLETGGDDTSDPVTSWTTSWSLDLDRSTLDGVAHAITTLYEDGVGATTEAIVYDAVLSPCPSRGNGNGGQN